MKTKYFNRIIEFLKASGLYQDILNELFFLLKCLVAFEIIEHKKNLVAFGVVVVRVITGTFKGYQIGHQFLIS